MLLLSLITAALAQPVLEVPVDNARDARRVLRHLGELGYSSTVVRPNGGLRVRLDLQAVDARAASDVAERLTGELGRGVLAFDQVPAALPPAVLVEAGPSLSLQLGQAEHVLFQFQRVLPDGQMNHTWSRRGAQVSVILEAIGGDLVSSRLLHGPEGSWIWVEGTRTDASPARAAEWIDRLAPGYILSSAFLAGFGGAVQPPSGCRTVKGRLLCVDAQPEQADEATVFEDLLRTKDGDWLPGRIRRYHAGKLVDHAVVLQVRLSDPAPEHWFDPNYPRIDASP